MRPLTRLPEVLRAERMRSALDAPPRAVRFRGYPKRLISEGQEILLGMIFGLIGLWITVLVFLYADRVICAVADEPHGCLTRPVTMAE